ncbi:MULTISPECIES: hypothetical protein [unclassified Methanoculleus]|uniref:hypothetical protein n=1 Tax=unclassified Methanoculleus TaxID=2619537 RepID=UPI0025FBB714|nr:MULTISPECIES: hypothetical protein [unclassified Methanoculleus]MCK9317070.1 hypothetical protein [Methanoculleus sp.]MDD2253439.1 hypothetical protein [Methanoculleus sp.]MDD2788663.1 hypothetical protein [Methanoculleus sp.]MDD3214982.1 hypothetical protein [Methanoculleus sp.]MDD4313956.1 hypothetical protein [Methanoculleus sp.]
MKRGIVVASLLVLALMTVPVGAFSADNLLITVDEDGSADITFNYTLSWIERIAVFFKIAEPEQELKSALEGACGTPVTVTSVESNAATFSIQSFARIKSADDGNVYSTPGLDFTGAQEVLESYWFAPLVDADFSPNLTLVRFPDGHEETFENQFAIPALSHTLP